MLPDRAALVGLLKMIFEGLDANDFSHTTIGSVVARACGEGLAVVDALDVRRLRNDGSLLEAIDGHYTMRHVDGEWQFATALACRQGWRQS